VKDREEDKELPQSEAAQNGKAYAENETARAERAGQKH
jgi:hypothetical protein